MPTDLQLIDGFEKLRERYAAAHGRRLEEGDHAEASGDALGEDVAEFQKTGTGEGEWSEARVVEAWLQAAEGREAASAPQRRRIRALARSLLREVDAAKSPPNNGAGLSREQADLLSEHEKLACVARKAVARLDSARRAKLRPLAPGAIERGTAEEIALWRRSLGGLAGLRGWRFLALLGRPVIVPDAPLRRTLWRLGLIASAPNDAGSELAAHAECERLSRLTGLGARPLGALLEWHSSPQGYCRTRPQCERCPLRPGCSWARFRFTGNECGEGAQSENGNGGPPRRSLAPLQKQIAAGKLEQLGEAELLATLIQGGTASEGPLEIAEQVLRRFGNLRGVDGASVAQLCEVRGVSRSRAMNIKAALELGRRGAERALQAGDPIRGSSDVWVAYRARFRAIAQEHFIIIMLDAKNRVLHDHIVSKGTLTGSLAHPREVFKEALRHSANGIILMHNHPSGDPHPSPEDRSVTQRLKEAGEILGVRLLDHIVLGDGDYYSFKDNELL